MPVVLIVSYEGCICLSIVAGGWTLDFLFIIVDGRVVVNRFIVYFLMKFCVDFMSQRVIKLHIVVSVMAI